MSKKPTGKPKTPKKEKNETSDETKTKGKIGAVLASAGALLSVVVSVTVVGLNLSKILENSRKGFLSREKLVIQEIRDSSVILDLYSEFVLAENLKEINDTSLFLFEVENQGASRDTVIIGVELPSGFFVGGIAVINAYRGVELDSLPYLQEQKGEDTPVVYTRILRFPNGGKILVAVWGTKSSKGHGNCKIWTTPAAWEGTKEFKIRTFQLTRSKHENQGFGLPNVYYPLHRSYQRSHHLQ